jgi:hypothetical protein
MSSRIPVVLGLRVEIAGGVALAQLARWLARDAIDHPPALDGRPLEIARRPQRPREVTEVNVCYRSASFGRVSPSHRLSQDLARSTRKIGHVAPTSAQKHDNGLYARWGGKRAVRRSVAAGRRRIYSLRGSLNRQTAAPCTSEPDHLIPSTAVFNDPSENRSVHSEGILV